MKYLNQDTIDLLIKFIDESIPIKNRFLTLISDLRVGCYKYQRESLEKLLKTTLLKLKEINEMNEEVHLMFNKNKETCSNEYRSLVDKHIRRLGVLDDEYLMLHILAEEELGELISVYHRKY